MCARPVARMERSEIRETESQIATPLPHSASLHAGYGDQCPLRRLVEVDVVVGPGRIAADAQAMAVEILHVHLAHAPGIVRWRLADDGAGAAIVGMERIDVV